MGGPLHPTFNGYEPWRVDHDLSEVGIRNQIGLHFYIYIVKTLITHTHRWTAQAMGYESYRSVF